MRLINLSSILTFGMLAAPLTVGRAQNPWSFTIRPSTPTLQVGTCTPIRLELLDAGGRESPRNPNGMRVGVSDFDWSVAPGGKVVGRYDGVNNWSACACPASAGTVATIMATYPAQSLAQKARVPGVAFQSSISLSVVAGNNTGVPVGCEKLKTTTAPAAGTAPWAITLTSGQIEIPIGTCGQIGIRLLDASGKDGPRDPAGKLITLSDFDMAATGGGVAGQYSGPASWSVCACQAGAVGSLAKITATYPGSRTVQAARVPGVAFQSSMSIPLGKALGSSDPSACSATIAVAPVTTVAPISAAVPVTTQPTTTQPILVGEQITKTAVPVATQPVLVSGPTTKTAVSAPPAPLPPGPSPTGVSVTGTPMSATLTWQPMAGVASYVVTRQAANVPPVEFTLSGTNAGMFDSGLRPTTAYTWSIRAIQSDGREGSAIAVFATLPAVNPSGFTAQQTGDGRVQLSWQPVSDASYYVVFGPGSSSGGVIVRGATSYTVTGAPIGLQTWAVGSYYDPGATPTGAGVGPNAVSTPAAEFPRVQSTVVAAVVAAAPPPVPPPAVSTAKWTAFKPRINGFRFYNTFTNSFIPPPANMETGGLCGGMSAAVLDWYNAGRSIPNQGYRPANNTLLHQYLYERQVTSLVQNLDKWAELGVNPGGVFNTKFFNWGLTARLTELRSFIDRGVPVPLGLKGLGAILDHSDHQVLAIGYDMGNAGDLASLKIYILDPNFASEILTLVPNIKDNLFYLEEHPENRWRTYFVDSKYTPMTPPNIVNPNYPSDGLVHELLFEFTTGPAFDLRGGADHVDVTITLSDNSSQTYTNISQDGRWLKDYVETAQVILNQPVPRAMIRSITISTNAPGGYNSANWDLKKWEVDAVVGGSSDPQHLVLSRPGYLFSGVRPSLVIQIP